jgi:hypothetical protein
MVYVFPDKAKPSGKMVRKAAGLVSQKDGRAAEGKSFGEFGFFIDNFLYQSKKRRTVWNDRLRLEWEITGADARRQVCS